MSRQQYVLNIFVCKGLCDKYCLRRKYNHDFLYKQGDPLTKHLEGTHKCRNCDRIYHPSIGVRCPCCGGRLALKPKHTSMKARSKRRDSYPRY